MVISSLRLSIQHLSEKKKQQPLVLMMLSISLEKKTIAFLREPSLDPCFCIKGGTAEGGYT